jgi:predicted transcriptional regulator
MAKNVGYSEGGESLLVKALGYSAKLRIIDLFLSSPYFDFSKEELARELGMSKQTLYKNFRDLEELGMVTRTRRIGRAILYRVNVKNPFVKMLDEQVNKLSSEIAEKERRRTEKPVALEAR